MNIFQIIQGVHNLSAGPTHSVARLTDELCLLGERASVLTLGRSPKAWPYRAPLKIHQGPLEMNAGISPGLMREIRRLSRHQCILHNHGIWRLANLYPLTVNRASPARIVCSPRGTLSPWSMRYKSPVKRPFWRLLQNPALRRCHCFHATSRTEYEHIRGAGFTAPVAISPNGIDIPELSADGRRVKRVVFMSRLDPVKGLDILLPAWTAVAGEHGDWELVIAGPRAGEYAGIIQDRARELRAPRVRFIGEALGDAKHELLSGASLFVLPSYSENFGIVVAEALAYGVPVITTAETPWADVVRNDCGWCIPAREIELRDALRQALSQPPAALHDMGRRGRDWMKIAYAWPSIAGQMERTYAWLLHGGARPDCIVET